MPNLPPMIWNCRWNSLCSLQPAELQGDTDAEVDAAWDQELRRRIDEVNSGTAMLISAEDVFAEVRRIVGR